jgi:23S rRNA-/tRNA-specific pseudouridylate synthase
LSPTGKAETGTRKFYVARVRGKLVDAREISVLMRWDGHANCSRVVELDGTPTLTLISEGGKFCDKTGTSLVHIEITSGHRHQIRAALSFIGHPIVVRNSSFWVFASSP